MRLIWIEVKNICPELQLAALLWTALWVPNVWWTHGNANIAMDICMSDKYEVNTCLSEKYVIDTYWS